MNIVLVEPEIPTNTGNIGRLCVGFNATLHLIGPLGFEITDSRVKRAGLDYWPDLSIHQYASFEEWHQQIADESRIFLFTTHTDKSYSQVDFQAGDWLVFGKESVGLSADIQNRFQEQLVTIPFPGKVRSFNLSNAVAIALSEANRQFTL
ncbi:tRNA (cytidine(34)-2'-O)-methyltransferase [bacterium SCSIO 12741]|nr:tRNA (cytidine(34)-2'-O)-methyltransferase [bacterium SCSIO 12741]